MQPPAKAESKKAYQPPKLSHYGSLTEMTAKGKGTSTDNPGKGKGGKT